MASINSIIKSISIKAERSADRYLKNFESANTESVPSFPKDFDEFNKIIGQIDKGRLGI